MHQRLVTSLVLMLTSVISAKYLLSRRIVSQLSVGPVRAIQAKKFRSTGRSATSVDRSGGGSGSGSGSGMVRRMNVQDFHHILSGEGRQFYQIVDVREKDELDIASIPGKDVIHLPLSEAASWTNKIANGDFLDSDKPVLCLCHHGIRSMRVATFLGKLFII